MADNNKANTPNSIKPLETLTRTNVAMIGNSNSPVQNNCNRPSTGAASSRQDHHNQSHYQVHQQMFMDRVRGVPMANQSNDFYYSEMHSTWQYNCTPQFFTNLPPPGVNATNVPILPNLSVPPPPYGVFPLGNTSPIYTGYTTAFQSNAGFVGPNGTMVTNTVGTVGAVSAFGGQVFTSSARSASSSTSNGAGGDTISSGSNSSLSGSNVMSMSLGLNEASRPKMSDATTQANLLKNTQPLDKLNISSSSSSSSTQLYGQDLLDKCNSLSSATGAGDSSSVAIYKNTPNKNSEVKLSQQKLHDLTRVSLRGSEIAEKLAFIHRNRPCFKKIDSLCARMKQDLIRPDGVLPNINSQGIAWAVKDFIFVFTRIINAWIIMKGYVYNTPDGLNKIKNVLPEGFMDGFSNWQDSTLVFIEFLIKSFVCLDNLVQKQKSSFTKTENNNNSMTHNNFATGNGNNLPNLPNHNFNNIFEEHFDLLNNANEKPLHDSLNKNYMYTMVEDSEETQRHANANGTYFKTGTYQPLQKSQDDPETSSVEQVVANTENNEVTAVRAVGDDCVATVEPEDYIHIDLKTLPGLNLTFLDTNDDPQTSRAILAPVWYNDEEMPKNPNLRINPTSVFGRDVIQKLNQLSDRILHLNNIEVFFKKEFTKNYYPDFISKCKYDYTDLQQIVLKCQNGQYSHLYEAIHDLKRIVYVGKNYLQLFENINLKTAIMKYEAEVNNMLDKPPYILHQFDHINGRPCEKLFNYSI